MAFRQIGRLDMLQTVKCTSCGKKLTEAIGEVRMPCRKCGKFTHVVITTAGIIDLSKVKIATTETVIK
jgi:predicted RNA-binding Zn-ribbon protein involved in translation (DUF1610 family)